MTITRKKGKTNQAKFAGIVVTASSKAEAIDRYRLAATGDDAQVLESESGSFKLVTCSANLEQNFHNVVSGNGSMIETDTQFESKSNTEDNAEVFLTVCADGCGDVIIAESESIVKFCPSCSTSIPDLSNEEINQLTESESSFDPDYPQGHQGIVVAASSFEEAHDMFFEVACGNNAAGIVDGSVDEMNSESANAEPLSFTTHSSCDFTFSPYLGEESLSANDDVVEDFTAESNAGEDFQAHYLLCESTSCTAKHIICSENEAVFCPSCSGGLVDPEDLAELEESNSSVEFEEDNLESDSMGDMSDEDLSDEDLSEDDSDLETDSAADDSDEDLSEDDSDDSDSDLEDLSEDDSDSDLEDLSEDDLDSESGDDSDDDSDIDIDLSDEDEEDEDEDEDLESESSLDFELNLLQAVAASEGELIASNLFTSHCGNVNGIDTWIAFYKSTPIATLSANACSEEISKIFNSPALADAIKAQVTESGVEKGLEQIGFQPLKPDLDLEIAVSQSLLDVADAKVETALASVAQREEDYAERFEAALSTSIMGINRNAFAGVSNPLRNSLVASLSAAGLRNPEGIIDQAITNSSDLYAKTLLAQAKDIISKAPEVQNQIAETISSLNFLTESSAVDEVESIGVTVKPTVTAQETFESDSSSQVNMQTAVKKLNLSRR